MPKVLITILSIIIAIIVPALLVMNGVRVFANDWYVHFEYNKPGFPADPLGMTQAQRTDLALTGLRSVLPQYDEGIALLERAQLPDGSAAFNERELGHMRDVRVLFGQLYPLHLIGLVIVVGLAIVLSRSADTNAVIPRALQWGSLLTLAIAAVLIVYILINFNTFFTQFHQVFFEGDTWLFRFDDTLIRLYPVPFWSDIATYIGVVIVAQALLLLGGTWFWLRSLAS